MEILETKETNVTPASIPHARMESREERSMNECVCVKADKPTVKIENRLMLDALRGFVIRTASGEAATPEAVQALPEVAKVVLDYQSYES